MGNIGYIGGNIGYIGSGSLNMDYPYDHGTHYQLWKPPGNYFARGEAPPPYEEAIALAQAESLNTCTVSVATSTQRQYPIGLTESEASQTITANTTNLINININNGGNLTATATGENHIASTLPSDAQNDTSVSNASDIIGNRESCLSYAANYYTIPVSASEICTSQNCDMSLGNNCNLSIPNTSNVKEVQTNQNNMLSSTTSISHYKPIERFTDRFNSSCTILPPPLFDNTSNYQNITNEDIAPVTKFRATGKRYHRTIPKHVIVDPIVNSSKINRNSIVTISTDTPSSIVCQSEALNKNDPIESRYNGHKQICQCPVQHTPISYLPSHVGINQVSNESVVGQCDNGRSQTMKKRIPCEVFRHTHTPQQVTSTQLKSIHTTSVHCKATLRKKHENHDGGDKNLYSNTKYVKMQYTTNKLRDEQLRVDNQTVLKKQNSLPRKTSFSSEHSMTLNSTLKNYPEHNEQECLAKKRDADVNDSTIAWKSSFCDQEKHRKAPNSLEECTEQNPVLPPKMHKHNNGRLSGAHRKSFYSNSKTHAISKLSSDHAKFSIPTTNTAGLLNNINKIQKSSYSNSLPRNIITSSHEYAQAFQSTQSSEGPDSNIASINFNTLPKKTNKLCARSSNLLTEVVNKVPSVINIPSPLQPPPLLIAGRCSANQPASIITNKRIHQNLEKASQEYSHKPTRANILDYGTKGEKPLPVLTTSTNCINPREHFLPNDNSLDDDYLSECENCKSAHGSRYYLEAEIDDVPQETMTLQRKMPENEEEQQNYYRVSSTLPTNTSRKTP
ncbi:uncharacterized protein LOC131691081 isoform X2 [Topomyia yanbarensis]|uniref:uncharacterized protein LOC131691081 isoform X2 n=1 Tax=Topomyia yanbarensis TaxID=2498891 RepID=UPI00273C5FE4|nr:uncharacterized protein LOC131691081 isoform X2 [Topomyia yanbarensis]XP_058833254.1 uncharacterized protein LOC131691081 isoform X2 [Topomyia yanbarensis]